MNEQKDEQPQERALTLGETSESAWRIANQSPPRDLKAIWTQLQNELEFAPEYAENCWYSIPYKDNKTGKTVHVEGIGIHGATALARAWGFADCMGGISADTGDKVICRGIFVDYKASARFIKEVVVNRYQISAKGQAYRLVGKHWENAVQSGISKAMRNSTLHGIPEYMKERFFDFAKKMAAMDKPGAPRITAKDKIEKTFSYFKKNLMVPRAAYDDYIQTELREDKKMTDEEIVVHLKGLYNAIRDGETTAVVVFGDGVVEGKDTIQPPKEKEASENQVDEPKEPEIRIIKENDNQPTKKKEKEAQNDDPGDGVPF